MVLLNRKKCCEPPPPVAGCCFVGSQPLDPPMCTPGVDIVACIQAGGSPVEDCNDCIGLGDRCHQCGFTSPPFCDEGIGGQNPEECPPGIPLERYRCSCVFTATYVVPAVPVEPCDFHPPVGLSCSVPGAIAGPLVRFCSFIAGGPTCNYSGGMFAGSGGTCEGEINPNCFGNPLLENQMPDPTGRFNLFCINSLPEPQLCWNAPRGACWAATASISFNTPCCGNQNPSFNATFLHPRLPGEACPPVGTWPAIALTFSDADWFPGGVTVSPLQVSIVG